MKWLPYALGLTAGVGLTLQVGMNAQLRNTLASAHGAALVSFLVGTAALIVVMLATRTPIPERETFAAVPVWAWFGGLLGAFYVACSTVVATQVGATALLGLVLVGQLVGAVIID